MSDMMGFCLVCAVLLVGWEVNSIKRILQQQAAGGSAAAKRGDAT